MLICNHFIQILEVFVVENDQLVASDFEILIFDTRIVVKILYFTYLPTFSKISDTFGCGHLRQLRFLS